MIFLFITMCILLFGYVKYQNEEPFHPSRFQCGAILVMTVMLTFGQALLGAAPYGLLAQWAGNMFGSAFAWYTSSCVVWLMIRGREVWNRHFQKCPYCDSTEVTTTRTRDIFEGTAPNGVLVRLTAQIDMHTCCNCHNQYTGSQAERVRDAAWQEFLKHGDKL